MASIKETLEVLEAVKVLKGIIVEELKDGFQYDDIADFVGKASASPAVLAALDGIEAVLPELKDLSLSEKLQLVYALVKVFL